MELLCALGTAHLKMHHLDRIGCFAGFCPAAVLLSRDVCLTDRSCDPQVLHRVSSETLELGGTRILLAQASHFMAEKQVSGV